MDISIYLKKQCAKINRALLGYLPGPAKASGCVPLQRAMHYAVLSGGKRIRPFFVLEACRAVGGNEKQAMPAACAIELIHSYSLVHDDLPCMDDDDTRRGRPSCHVKFGEDMAVLTGDALLTLAFQILNEAPKSEAAISPQKRMKAAFLIAKAAGTEGMAGGQALELEMMGRKKRLSLAEMEAIHARKSGALIEVSARVGAFLGGGSKSQVEALGRYGKYVGLLFQIVDDILDQEGYAKTLGISEAKSQALKALEKAKRGLRPFGPRAAALGACADFIFSRNH